MKLLTRMVAIAALLALGVLGTTSTVDARFVLTLDDGVNPIVVVVDDADGGGGTVPDGTPGDGFITFNGIIGNFVANVTTGISKPLIGPASIDLNSVNVTGTAAGTLTIKLTDTDFQLPGQALYGANLTNEWGGTTDGTVTAQGWLDATNTEFGMPATTTGLQGPFGPGAFADTVTAVIAPFPAGPFSLTEQVVIAHTAGGQITSFDKKLAATPVPEPSSVLLLGFGILGALGVSTGLRRKNRQDES